MNAPAPAAAAAPVAAPVDATALRQVLLGLATVALLLGHGAEWLGRPGAVTAAVQAAGTAVGLVGLFLCAGWAGGAALADGAAPTAGRRWATVALLAFAAYVFTGAAKAFLVDAIAPSAREVLRIATLRHVPSHSGYFLVIAAGAAALAVAPALLRWATASRMRVRLLAAPGVLLAALPLSARLDPALGMLVGGAGHYLYPLLVWSPLLWVGAHTGRHGAGGIVTPGLASSVAGTVLCAALLATGPGQHPPTLGWLVAGMAGTWAAYGLAGWLLRGPAGRVGAALGRAAGPVLVLVHVVIFAAVAAGWKAAG